MTGLPPSAGNTVILTIIDCFSKAAHFVALPKLPTALETARLLTQHVFRLHGIPTYLQYIGPFEISALVNPVSVRLKLPRNMKIHNVFHVSQLKPVRSDSLEKTCGFTI